MEICKPSECTGCGSCASVCPVGAITLKQDDKGFFAPYVNDSACIDCSCCKTHCHILNYEMKENETEETYAACAKDSQIRLSSSSGGIVTQLAEKVFSHGGIAVGAVFDENLCLHEDIAFTRDEFAKNRFARSKYVQSETGDCFVRVKEWLDAHNGAPCLFIGTPCQNAALKTFLGSKNYSGLLTVDFVCHGVPSPGVFKSYCEYLEEKYHSRIKSVDFRVKNPSWTLSSTVYAFKNGKKIRSNMMEDYYTSCFVNNNCLRAACYECRYSVKNRASDITLCDYWGKREVKLTEDDEALGVSAVIIHTKQGKAALSEINPDVVLKPISYSSVTKTNTRLFDGHLDSSGANSFWDSYLSGEKWRELGKKYSGSFLDTCSLKTKILMKYGNSFPIKQIKKCINKLKRR